MKLWIGWLGTLAVVFALGCGSNVPTVSEPDLPALIDALVAPPTSSEIDVALAAFDQMAYVCDGVGLEVIDTREGQFAMLSLVAYQNDGLRIYGVVSRPKTEGTFPILLYNHGGESGVFAGELDHPLAFGFVQVASAFRSEPVMWFGQRFVSEGTASLWDADVSDALVMLACAEQLPYADPSRILGFGASRGGGVALLAAVRVPGRFHSVVDMFGPTDFFDPSFRNDFEALANGEDDTRPGVGFLRAEVLAPYIQGDLSLESARQALLRRSALYFSDRLPPVQIHHGTLDEIVPISQSDRMAAQMQARNQPVEYFQYPGVGHEPELGGELFLRVLRFLGQ